MSPSSEERLRRIAERKRTDTAEPAGSRLMLILGLLMVVAVAFGLWSWLGRVQVGDTTVAPLGGRIMAWYLEQQSDDLTAPSDDATPISFEIVDAETLPSVAQRLEAEGVIQSADAFRLLARVRGLDRSIQAGSHVVSRDMSAEEVLDALQAAVGEQVSVTIPEGWRAEEVADLLSANGLADRAEFLALVGSYAGGGRAILADRPDGAGLEGYLFPDTYVFDPEPGAAVVVERLLDTLEARVTPDLRSSAATAGLSVYELLTLASIVEREAVVDSERGTIARVYLNRLETPPYLLNADPTLQYALGFQADLDTWWKRPLYDVDLAVESAYNTYTVGGLPPGPIASAGLASIEAVVYPPEGNWQYFVANDRACDGTHVFAETFEGHLDNIATYQTGDCGG